MAVEMYFAWGQSSASVAAGETVSVPVTADIEPSVDKLSALFSPYAVVDSATTSAVVIRGASAGSITVYTGRDIAPQGSMDMTTYPIFTLTVTAPVDDESYLNKRGLTHFWNNIDTLKQDKLTAGAGISISNNVISATGGGTADAVDWGHITGSMSNQTDLMTALGAKANSADLATVATSGSYNDLSDKPDIMTGLTEMSYGESNAWAKFITAYRAKQIVYCRASSNSNPATGSQTRKAFMAYVNNAENPTEVEFQYVRSVSNKTASQPVDQVFGYKLTSANGATWTVQTRDMGPKLAQGTNTTVSYSNGTYKISATGGGGGGPTVVQTTGQSTTDVMSQKAVTDIIGNVETILRTLNSGTGAA